MFDRSFYLEGHGRYVCVAAAGLGQGPLTALCRPGETTDWRGLGIDDGAVAWVRGSEVAIAGGPVLDLGPAALWTPPPWPASQPGATLAAGLSGLRAAAVGRVPADGLAPLVLGGSLGDGLARAMARAAGLHLATLRDWIDASLAGEAESLAQVGATAITGLMGLGAGLTPSGDDVLAGAVLALHATGEAATAVTLGRMIEAAPADATSPLSRALLQAAILGHPSEAVHAVIAGLLGCDQTRALIGLDALGAVGHTSGWDMLAGIVIGLEAVAKCRKHD